MALRSVVVSAEVWRACVTHALTTEVEEIMGLLLGDTSEDGCIAYIWGAVPQARADRRKDRVETTPEQLAAASAEAEEMSRSIGKKTRVIGWYHSHPHITVHPSNVDLRTQGSFQRFDPGFVGIIISCFNEDAITKSRRIQVIAFQSVSKAPAEPSSRSLILSIHLERELEETTNQAGKMNGVFADGNQDEMVQYSPGMQEAMHRSTLDMNSQGSVCKEVPLSVATSQELGIEVSPPDPLVALQRTLFEEEKAAYSKAMSRNLHLLAPVHHTSQYQVTLAKHLEFCLLPSMAVLWEKQQENKAKLRRLHHEARGLELDSLQARP